jgi:arsenate reductase (thioredoxin)
MVRRGLGALVISAMALSASAEEKPGIHIVFVCEHGSVKSLIASQWFNRLAAARGLQSRAISRGLSPDANVPQGIADNLAKDGFAVASFKPTKLDQEDLKGALRVISIGADATSVTGGSRVRVDAWNDIPAASENYAASRDAIRARIEALLKELKEAPTPK